MGRDRQASLESGQGGVVNTESSLRVLQTAVNFLTGWRPISFSRRALLHEVNYTGLFI